MFDRLSLLALFALSLGCSAPVDVADETTEPKAPHPFVSDAVYDTSFLAGDCKFMTVYSDALADAGIDHRVEQDGSISYRSEDEDAVRSIESDLPYHVVAELDLSCSEGAQND